MTPQDLSLATGARIDRAKVWLEPIVAAMLEYNIDTPDRQAAFLAQIGHESGGLHWTTEIWGPTEAQRRYEGRTDLGNVMPGDGFKFRGRGLIQITGRENFARVSEALDLDCIEYPELLSQPVNAARSAGHYWKSRGLNEIADAGDFLKITKRINGGTNGLAERTALWESAKEVLA